MADWIEFRLDRIPIANVRCITYDFRGKSSERPDPSRSFHGIGPVPGWGLRLGRQSARFERKRRTQLILRIRGWKHLFENSESRKLKRLTWVAVPNKLTGNGYTALVDHPNGAAHLGAWYAIVEICSLRDPRELRGTLPESDGTIPGISRSLGRISRLPPEIFMEVLPRLIHDPNIQWIEQDPIESGESPGTSVESPETSGIHGRELQGRELQGNTARATLSGMRWKSDEQYARFVADYLGTGAALIDADFADAYEFCWRVLDFSQKLERVSSLTRHAEEYHADPRFVPKPRKFLETEWERQVRPLPRGPKSSDSLADRTIALVQRRIANGDSPL